MRRPLIEPKASMTASRLLHKLWPQNKNKDKDNDDDEASNSYQTQATSQIRVSIVGGRDNSPPASGQLVDALIRRQQQSQQPQPPQAPPASRPATFHAHHSSQTRDTDIRQCLVESMLDAAAECQRAKANLKSVPLLLGALVGVAGCRRKLGLAGARRLELCRRLSRAPAMLAMLFSLTIAVAVSICYALSYENLHLHFARRDFARFSAFADGGGGGVAAVAQQRRRDVSTTSGSKRPTVYLKQSGALLHGSAVDGSFVGVPYAEPPVGELRWRRPVPWQCRGDKSKICHLDAGRHKPPCGQLSLASRQFVGAEDCLYLDVYSAAFASANFSAASTKLPVLFYVHGGFLTFGSPRADNLNGEQNSWLSTGPSMELARALDAVIVAPAFRLQAFGFMATTTTDTLGANSEEPPEGRRRRQRSHYRANFGLYDQLAALEWTGANVAHFGGDPNSITVFGPDSAAALALALLTQTDTAVAGLRQSKLSAELSDANQRPANNSQLAGAEFEPAESFKWQPRIKRRPLDKVWLVDPATFYDLSVDTAAEHHSRLFDGLLVSLNGSQCSASQRPLDCLRRLDAELVAKTFIGADEPTFRLDDENGLPIRGILADQLLAVDDELVVGGHPFASPSLMSLDGGHVELLIGSAAQAADYWHCPAQLDAWSWRDFQRYVATSLNSFSNEAYATIMQAYGVATNLTRNFDAAKTYLSIVSDIRQVCPANQLAEAMASRGHSVERYIVVTKPTHDNDGRDANQTNERLDRAPGLAGDSSDDDDEDDDNNNYVVGEFSKAEMNKKDAGTNQAQDSTTAPQSQSLNLKLKLKAESAPKLPHFAFHTWDLIAFFGYDKLNAELNFKPRAQDAKFQQTIRQMVTDFVHKTFDQRKLDNVNNNGKVKIIDEAANVKFVDEYKTSECKLLKRHLTDSYAWVS